MSELQIFFYSFGAIGVCFTIFWAIRTHIKNKPSIRYMTYQAYKNYFNVTIYNNTSRLLKIKKASRRRFWWNKRLSVGTTDVNNESHSNALAKRDLGNLALSSDGREDTFKLYLEPDEKISEQTFVFKTNAGTCRHRTTKIPR